MNLARFKYDPRINCEEVAFLDGETVIVRKVKDSGLGPMAYCFHHVVNERRDDGLFALWEECLEYLDGENE